MSNATTLVGKQHDGTSLARSDAFDADGGLTMFEHTAVGFIGLGHLGLPIANNLLEAGHSLRVYNRTQEKTEPFLARGAHIASQPFDAVMTGGIVASVLWDDAALESVVTSDGFLERLGPGGVHISMSTVLPETARRLGAMHERMGSFYVDAPIFGGPDAAADKKLSVVFAGAASAKARIRPLLWAMGANGIFDFGDAVGTASAVKLVGNFLVFSAANSLAEALSIADKSGVDRRAAVEMLTKTLFPAPVYERYGKMIAAGAPAGLRGGIPQKDIGLLKRMAEQVGVRAPLASRLYELVRETSQSTPRADFWHGAVSDCGATTVRRLRRDDAQTFRTVLLDALKEHPDAFSASFEDELRLPIETFEGRLESGEMFGAFAGDALVGIVTLQPGALRKRRHVAMLWGMYVVPTVRRTGVAACLMAAALEHASAQVDQVELFVNIENDVARRFYRRFGFEPYGHMRRALRVDGRDYDAEMMVRVFR
jgi:3-hydroxyisobutyrate dehydrogenase-like beta-hydroxyacid dehydrogenase/ribosomal protein S18 acetylase RimI-like enzyme